mmetsp:Transcript_25121/g.24583  ORF Transcript_25121/g.24583 Transcript_25121/m.24583 type:complete len:125 (+) Transcript_25121:243-617(+)|eukprot:CAMPEP_0170546002 /NCGR_PEP_ID=MMETSP0211-20121228/4391_1 /TAXON_ID=311385 /ORGANISM="Pseudokeronopsis sp., Strain OXSARD2" /LENGTH=124 /DNA_ID=CAMNT_0010850235 /DNA_START=265 /DNA_END=639 /DNA_ORIENTATION=-
MECKDPEFCDPSLNTNLDKVLITIGIFLIIVFLVIVVIWLCAKSRYGKGNEIRVLGLVPKDQQYLDTLFSETGLEELCAVQLSEDKSPLNKKDLFTHPGAFSPLNNEFKDFINNLPTRSVSYDS